MRSWGDVIVLPPPYLHWVDTVATAPSAPATKPARKQVTARKQMAWRRWSLPQFPQRFSPPQWPLPTWPLQRSQKVTAAVVLATGLLFTALLAGWLDGLPLLSPAMAGIVESAGGLALLGSWYRRKPGWWSRQVPLMALGSATLTGLIAGLLRWSGTVVDPYPSSFFVWVGMAFAAWISVLVTVRNREQLHRITAWSAVPLTAAGAFLLINDEYGLWPHLGNLLGHSDKISTAELYRQLNLPPGTGHPSKGIVASIDIPADRSHFAHRQGSVYLPPAYFTEARADLPVLLVLPGTPGAPDNWISAGGAAETADAFAAEHDGTAPIMLFVDSNGSATADTECVDGPQGNAETYLTADVPGFVGKTLHVSHNATRWGIVGFSAGGTCAVMLALVHPQVFSAFVDVAGDARPTLGNAKNTLSALFGGSEAERDAHDPGLLLAAHRYKGTTGWFAVGAKDPERRPAAHTLAVATQKSGGTAYELTGDGGHDWPFASGALQQAMPPLCHALGVR